MGLDTSAKLIFGVSLEGHTREKCNPKTGKPYKKPREESYFVFRGTDIEVSVDEEAWGDEDMREKFVHYCDYADRQSYFIGIEVASTDSHRRSMSNGEFNSELWSAVPPIENIDIDELKVLLFSLKYKEEPTLFILQELSY